MAVCTDITRIIELEKQGRMLRAKFFSSVAHELRTPLNSVIPIVKLLIAILAARQPPDLPKVLQLLTIVQNGTIHLENVINDALDVTRLENNKFEIHKEPFRIRDSLKDVYDIMKFQVDQKNLKFRLKVS